MGKNILEVCLSPNLGGLELFTFHCYHSFVKKTTCKVVLAPDKKLDKYLKCEDKFYLKRNKFFPFVPALKLAKYIDENNIDIIHFHWTKDMITVVLAKLLSLKKPQIIQSRHMGMTRFKDDIYHRWAYKNINKIHAITKLVKEQLIEYIPTEVLPQIELVYLGVEDKEKSDISELQIKYNLNDEFVVGIIGRIQEEKGQHIVLEALHLLQDLDIKLFIIGDGMNEEYPIKLHQMCRKFGLEDKVIFTGFTKEVDRYMKLCNVTVLATSNEAFGLVVIESMANETPVIATDRGGPLEIIDDKVDGLLFDGSSKDLANKLEFLYKNKNLSAKLAKNSLKKVHNKFNFNTQLDKLYEMIVKDEK